MVVPLVLSSVRPWAPVTCPVSVTAPVPLVLNVALARLAVIVPERVSPMPSARMPTRSVPRAVLKTMALRITVLAAGR